MIFQHTIDKVLSGEKRQTRRRRIVGAGERGITALSRVTDEPEIREVLTANNRIKWRVGGRYSVQPGRGQKGVARIRITGIRSEDVRWISDADAIAEGFESRHDFLNLWVKMHDYRAGKLTLAPITYQFSAPLDLSDRPAERYQAWVLEFELCAVVESGTIKSL